MSETEEKTRLRLAYEGRLRLAAAFVEQTQPLTWAKICEIADKRAREEMEVRMELLKELP